MMGLGLKRNKPKAWRRRQRAARGQCPACGRKKAAPRKRAA